MLAPPDTPSAPYYKHVTLAGRSQSASSSIKPNIFDYHFLIDSLLIKLTRLLTGLCVVVGYLSLSTGNNQHQTGVVRLYRTFFNYIFIGEAKCAGCVEGETRCAGCFCTSSGWFKCIEPPRTFSNHIIAEIARCVEFFHMSSGWFDCTDPSLTTCL